MQIPVAIDATVPTGKSTKRKSKPKTTVVQSKSKDADLPLPSYAVQETPQPGFLNPTLATKTYSPQTPPWSLRAHDLPSTLAAIPLLLYEKFPPAPSLAVFV